MGTTLAYRVFENTTFSFRFNLLSLHSLLFFKKHSHVFQFGAVVHFVISDDTLCTGGKSSDVCVECLQMVVGLQVNSAVLLFVQSSAAADVSSAIKRHSETHTTVLHAETSSSLHRQAATAPPAELAPPHSAVPQRKTDTPHSEGHRFVSLDSSGPPSLQTSDELQVDRKFLHAHQ